MLVEARAHGFGHHVARGRLQGYQDPHRGFLPVQHAAQVAHIFDAGLAAFDLNDDLLRLARLRVVAEKNLPVNAVVRAFLLLDGPRAIISAEARVSSLTDEPIPRHEQCADQKVQQWSIRVLQNHPRDRRG